MYNVHVNENYVEARHVFKILYVNFLYFVHNLSITSVCFRGSLEEAEQEIDMLEAKLEKVGINCVIGT